MRAQVTTNTKVTVRLTHAGVNILRERHEQLQRTSSADGRPFVAPEDNMYTAELWWLMMVFGKNMSPLRAAPFDHDISFHQVVGDVEL